MSNFTKIAQEALENDKGFIGNNNYKVIKVEKNYCELEGIITQTSLNNLNMAHGGYIFGLADTAAGIAAMTNGGNVVTIDSSINYIKPAKGNKIKAIASVIKNGKVIRVYEVKIIDEKEELVAKSTLSFYNVDNNK